MSIIVTDMEMPLNCWQCEFGRPLNNDSAYCIRKPKEQPIDNSNGRPSYCPLKEMEYEIISDCMYDKEHLKYVPTIYMCGCCHAKVNKTDTICWHCKSKLNPKKYNDEFLEQFENQTEQQTTFKNGVSVTKCLACGSVLEKTTHYVPED